MTGIEGKTAAVVNFDPFFLFLSFFVSFSFFSFFHFFCLLFFVFGFSFLFLFPVWFPRPSMGKKSRSDDDTIESRFLGRTSMTCTSSVDCVAVFLFFFGKGINGKIK